MVKMWGLWLLIFNFYTGSWEPAPIKGAVWFEKQETCIEVMAEYNRMMMMTNTAVRFVCEEQEFTGEKDKPTTAPDNNEYKKKPNTNKTGQSI